MLPNLKPSQMHTPMPQLRIARPVRALEPSVAIYRNGLGLQELGRFEDHAGFDGVMLGLADAAWHFEFTFCRDHPVAPAPTAEDLLVFYLPDESTWHQACQRMQDAGFSPVQPFNPYWGERGKTFEDPDGYRIVLQNAAWSAAPTSIAKSDDADR